MMRLFVIIQIQKDVNDVAGSSAELKIPTHIAFVMDGNGRWAKKRFMPRNYGHSEGARSLKTVIRSLAELGVKYATFYAFSTENWNRPQEEVDGLMQLFDEQLDSLKEYEKENIRLLFIGDRTRLAPGLIEKMAECESKSADRTGLNVIIAVNYGGQDEIVRAVRKVAELAGEGYIKPQDISGKFFESLLDTNGISPVDLMVRTGGEKRLSNFLIWQNAYAEFYFCDTLWPDFGKKELIKAIEDYTSRDRRFGKVSVSKADA